MCSICNRWFDSLFKEKNNIVIDKEHSVASASNRK